MQIKYLRQKALFTQKKLAEVLHVTQSTISDWETGNSAPSATILPRLARVLGCSIDALFDEPEPEPARDGEKTESVYTDF